MREPMDENLIVALIINVITFIAIPFCIAYRKGYFINFGERLSEIKYTFNIENKNLPQEWTITKIRQLSLFEKAQIERLSVRFMPKDMMGYWVEVSLKTGKSIFYSLGENKGYWNGDIIPKEQVLIRTWKRKGYKPYNDIMPLVKNTNKLYEDRK